MSEGIILQYKQEIFPSTNATLGVIVRTGSTVTVTRSGTTLSPISWSKADNENETCVLFSIPSSLFSSSNAWTVTATLSSSNETKTQTIIIDENRYYEIFLTFDLYLIRHGQVQSGYSLSNNSSIAQYPLYVRAKGGSGGTAYWYSVGTVQNISYQYIVCIISDRSSTGGKWGIAKTGTYSQNGFVLQGSTPTGDDTSTKFYLDVSNVSFSEARYVAFAMQYGSRWIHITDLYFTNHLI